jgi:hypothetical protein
LVELRSRKIVIILVVEVRYLGKPPSSVHPDKSDSSDDGGDVWNFRN